MLWLVFLLACARCAVAIYPEQLGEFDWLLQGLGRTTLSVFHQKRLLVATDGGVIASVNVASGSLDWRVVLPKHTSVEQFVFADASPIYAHTMDAAAGSSALQVFNASSGSMLWEHTFFAAVADGLHVDMQVSEARHQLLVLAGNALHVFSTTSGVLLWSWKPEVGSRVQLSSLVVPEQPPKRGGSSRVAVGCVLGNDNKCSKTALVTADFDEQKCSLQLLAALPGAPWQSLRASVAEQGAPQPVDSVLSASSTHVGVLGIASGKAVSLAWPGVRAGSDESQGPVEARILSLVLDGSVGAAVLVASRCSAFSCELFRVAGLQGAPSLQRLVGCAGSASTLLLQRSPAFTSAVRHAGCAMAVAPEAEATIGDAKTCASNGSCSATTVTVRTLSLLSADAGAAAVVDEFSAEMPNQAFSSLLHGSLSAFRTPKLEASARVLLVTSAGSTLLLQHAIAKGPAALELLWRREEALASVTGAVMLDAHKPGLGAAHPHGNEEDLISWRSRLGLQLEDAQDAVARLTEAVQGLAALPERVNALLLSVGGALEHTFPFNLLNGQQAPFRGMVSKDVRVTLSPAARASAQSKARRFGFDKLGVTLSARSGGGLVVVGMDLLSAEPLWVAELPLPSPPSFAKVFALSRTEVCLVASSEGRSLVFRFDAASGAVGGGGVSRARVLSAATTDAVVEGSVLSVFQMGAGHGHGHGRNRFHLLVEAAGAGGTRKVVPYPLPSEGGALSADSRGEYVHHLDEASGRLDTYRVLPLRVDASEHELQPVATAVFEPSSERIVSAAAPSVQDTVNSLFTTLGDDSLLLKYVNPHTLLVTSVSPPNAASPYYSPRDDDEAALVQLHLTLVDTVSAKIIYRASLESGTAPVHAVLVENALVATYWNARTKRCELSSVALFEGMIDRYGLTPLASKQSAAAAQAVQQRRNFSAFSSLGPLAMQKTFVLPKTVTAAHHTVTAQGIANKNLLLGVASGQVFALDTRQISPRRPLTEPSQGEREEGLFIYQPFLFLSPLAAVTHNYNLAAGPELIVSAAARLESSSLVLAASRCDLAFNRWLSSGGFDMLASDFNAFSLVMLLVSLAVLVLLLQRAARAKALKSSWQ